MKQRTKKAFAWVMTFAMLLSLLPAAGTGITASASPEGTELTAAGGALNSGSYYLSCNITLTSDITIASDQTVTLDLNGYVLTGTGSGSVITNNGMLTITDSNTGSQNHKFQVAESGLWVHTDSGTATYTYDSTSGLKKGGVATTDIPKKDSIIEISGGCITGGVQHSGYGGGVINYGALYLNGGNIVGNNVGQSGGGVYVGSESSFTGTFEMTGGSVTGNYTGSGGGVMNYGSLTMSGGRIAYNTAGNGGFGGGVYNNNTFQMIGGSISGNAAKSDSDGDGGRGGGVYTQETFAMTGGNISGNTAERYGAGLYIVNNNVTLGGTAQIFGNTKNAYANNVYLQGRDEKLAISADYPPKWTTPIGVTAGAGLGAFTTNGTATDEQYFTSDNAAYKVQYNSGGYLELVEKTVCKIDTTEYKTIAAALEDVTSSTATTITMIDDDMENVTISADRNITLDLNGHVLKGTGNGSVITNSGTLTITDSATTNNTHYFKVSSTGLWKLQSETPVADYTFDSTDGLKTASDGKATTDIPATDKIIAVAGGCITGGTGTDYGGGIYSAGVLNITDGNIIGNAAQTAGGGVCYGNSNATTTISGGSIIGNTAQTGGGVYSTGAVTISDTANISENKATGDVGGGVCGNAEVTITGGNIIGNTAQTAGGVYGNLTVQMSGGNVSGNTAQNIGGGVYSILAIEMSGGSVSSNQTSQYGGGMYCGGAITINGTANISENTTTNGDGGGVCGNTTVTIGGEAKINRNKANRGGGVYANSTVQMNGTAKISENEATKTVDGITATGGGVCSWSTVSISGGSICGNKAEMAGGLYSVDLKVGGETILSGNTLTDGTTPNNVYLSTNQIVTVDSISPLTGSASIGVTTETVPTADNPVDITNEDSANYEAYFTSDDSACYVKHNTDHLELAIYTIRVAADITNGTMRVDSLVAKPGDTVPVTATPDSGYTLDTITVTDKDGNDVTTTVLRGTTITVPEAEKLPITIRAAFTPILTPTPTPTPSSGSSDRDGGGNVSMYSTSVTNASNGTVQLNKTNAAKGATVTITATPNEGYVVNRVYVTDADGNAVDTTKKDETHYTFSMPAAKVTVAVTFQPESTEVDSGTNPDPAVNPFTDVAESDYFYTPVLWAVKNGITNGVTETTFCPYDITTRAQMVTFLWRASGSPEAASATNPFTDVTEGDYFCKAVLWGYENGYVKGTSETTFSPNDTVTRGQAVTFLGRMAGITDEEEGYAHAFTDVDPAQYYSNSIAWASQKGITNGTGENAFSPDRGCQRGEVVTFLHRNATL